MSDPTLGTRDNTEDRSWVLKPITDVAGVRHALIASLDGMLTGMSESLRRDDAEGIAAMSSAALSASRTATNTALGIEATAPVQTVTSVSKYGTHIIMPAGDNAFLVAVGEPGTVLGPVAHTMATQARKLGETLSVAARSGSGTPS